MRMARMAMLSVQQAPGIHMRLPCSIALLAFASALASAAPPPAVLEYRHHMFDPPVMLLANRTIELMFDTARVEPGSRVWKLPKDLRALDFTYEFKGRTLPAGAAAENTFTDALLILK